MPRHNALARFGLLGLFMLAWPAGAAEDSATIKSNELKAPEKTSTATSYNALVLRGLNKVTAKTQTFDTPVGTTIRFGTLEIAVHRCWQSPPAEKPEHAALLEVMELKPGEAPEQIFLGWMFASSPGLSGIEHPVYDITVIACETKTESVR